nr:retrovirus-related Pol polyprotein from transposon TNT 1-94 [Tanacetum cinerariifolium]
QVQNANDEEANRDNKAKKECNGEVLTNDVSDLLRNNLDSIAYSRSCLLLLTHLSPMSKQRECPDECKEAVSTLMFAAARFADLPELRELKTLFVKQYGNSIEPYVNPEDRSQYGNGTKNESPKPSPKRKPTHTPSVPTRSGLLPAESVATPIPIDGRKGLARQSKRKTKLPKKFNDHIMSNLSKNKNDSIDFDKHEEIRVGNDVTVDEIEENSCAKDNDEIVDGEKVEDGCGNVSDKNVHEEIENFGIEKNNEVFGWADKEFVDCNIFKSMGKNDVEKEMEYEKQSKLDVKENVSALNDSAVKIVDANVKSNLPNNLFVKTYAKTAEKVELNKNLFSIHTCKKDNGDEVVVFDEEIDEEGSKKWLNTICSYFVGCNMNPAELRYNIRRMLRRFGLYDIISNGNSVWLFKFINAEGMNKIVDQSPWMVNRKHLMVQKWNPNVCVEKAKPNKIHVWIKLFNFPLEAWSVKRINALASRLGKPLVMDEMTAIMCHNGTGRSAFARVLVNTEASKGFKDTIEIQYKDKNNNGRGKNKGKEQAKKNSVVNGKGKVNAKAQYMYVPKIGGLKKRRSFRFVNYIADKDEFADFVRKEWETKIKGFNDEINLLHKKSKIKWLSEGDQNTTYFCGILKSRKHKGIIKSICDENGKRFEEDNVASVFVEHFKKSMGTKHDVQPLESKDMIFDNVLRRERQELWALLQVHKNIASQRPWILMRDFNVTLKLLSTLLEDLNPNSSIMRKLDRIMINEEFLQQFQNAHRMFLPFVISDHSPAVVVANQLLQVVSKPGSRVRWLTRIDQEDVFVVRFFGRSRRVKVLEFFDCPCPRQGVEDLRELLHKLCIESGIARHLTVVGTPQQNGLAERVNRTLMDKIPRAESSKMRSFRVSRGCEGYRLYRLDNESPKIVTSRNVIFNESVMYKDRLKDSGVGTSSMQVLHGFEFEVEPLGDHTFEVEPQENVDQGAGLQEVQTQDLIYYHLARDREQHLACELFGYREDINEAAFAVVVVEKIYTHESPTFNNTVVCEVISKWKAGMKDDRDAWLDVYVLSNNDMVFSYGCKAEIGSTKSLLKREFDMKDLREAKKILSMEIVRDRNNRKSVQMPSGRHFNLSLKDCPIRDCDVERMSKVPYANAVGSIMYLMVCTRPDIAYAVSIVSRYLANPGKNHLKAVKWILKYLRGTANVGLIYGTNRSNHKDITGFVDSDYAKDPDKGMSITGYAFLVQGCVVSWKATLQHVVALSTTKAEYMALTEAVKEAIWLRGLLEELCVELSKRILGSKAVEVLKVGTKHNAADALTKVVPRYKLQHCLELLSVADKEEFTDCVRKEWETKIKGCYMYKVVQKLKRLKNPVNKINLKNGNLTDKANAASILNEYVVASNEELKLLHQKAKIKWLSEGDQNTTYFHGILKSRKHKGRIESICDKNGELNATLIALVPKVDVPNKVYEFRPIACCNVIYKSISKILTNRLKVDVDSVEVNKLSIDQFSSISGLLPNIGKNTIFFRSVPLNVQNDILGIILFQVGCLPMKYQVVPLVAKKLGFGDCKSLVDKVAKKINCWKNKEIEKLLKGILWCQGPLTNGKAKVAWKQVCMPKDQGGLGNKSVKNWNEVILIKQLWKIIEGLRGFFSNNLESSGCDCTLLVVSSFQFGLGRKLDWINEIERSNSKRCTKWKGNPLEIQGLGE